MNKTEPVIRYDYTNQAWIIDDIYQDCGHPQKGATIPGRIDSWFDSKGFEQTLTIPTQVWDGCNCYGRRHAGETAPTAPIGAR